MKKFSFLLLITQLLIQPIASALALAETMGDLESQSQAQAALWQITSTGWRKFMCGNQATKGRPL